MLLDSLHTTKFLHQSGQLTMSLITLTATDELSYETSFLYQGKENLDKKSLKRVLQFFLVNAYLSFMTILKIHPITTFHQSWPAAWQHKSSFV